MSLGLPCTSDRQCARTDPNSRCIGGLCDCAATNSSCGAAATGCHKGTFQVQQKQIISLPSKIFQEFIGVFTQPAKISKQEYIPGCNETS